MSHLLDIKNLVTGYRKKEILKGINIYVDSNELVAIIGHNGAGKSTLFKAAFGIIPVWDGKIKFNGDVIKPISPHLMLNKGVVYVPQGGRVFTNLTVKENLKMGGNMIDDKTEIDTRIERVLSFFPELRDRLYQRAGTLSGGEKQMLTLGIALILSPRLILLDEPSLGLAPKLVKKTLDHIRNVNVHTGTAILIIEQEIREVLGIAQRVYVFSNGQVSFSSSADELDDITKIREAYL
jgi:branched-chain amino acid transport system ATP-binding protein